jgi:hypothetical protein
MKIRITFLLFLTSISLFGQTNQESIYLKTRNSYIKYFEKMTTNNPDWTEIDKQNRDSLLVLEKMLKEILKSSFAPNGEINLETLVRELGFGNLDGLVINKNNVVRNSEQVFVTTKALFFDYFKNAQIISIDTLTKEQLDNIFTSAFGGGEAQVTTFSIVKKSFTKDSQTYGCIGSLGQGSVEALTPDCILVLASKGNFIYLTLEYLDISIRELQECKSISDSLYSQSRKYERLYIESNPKDKSLINKSVDLLESSDKQYYECYQKNLKNKVVFMKIENQVINAMKYVQK